MIISLKYNIWYFLMTNGGERWLLLFPWKIGCPGARLRFFDSHFQHMAGCRTPLAADAVERCAAECGNLQQLDDLFDQIYSTDFRNQRLTKTQSHSTSTYKYCVSWFFTGSFRSAPSVCPTWSQLIQVTCGASISACQVPWQTKTQMDGFCWLKVWPFLHKNGLT